MTSYKMSAFTTLLQFRKTLHVFLNRPQVKCGFFRHADHFSNQTLRSIGKVCWAAGGTTLALAGGIKPAQPDFPAQVKQSLGPAGNPITGLLRVRMSQYKRGNLTTSVNILKEALNLLPQLKGEGILTQNDETETVFMLSDMLSDELIQILIELRQFVEAEGLCKELMRLGFKSGRKESDESMINQELQLSKIYSMTNRDEDAIKIQIYCIQKLEQKLQPLVADAKDKSQEEIKALKERGTGIIRLLGIACQMHADLLMKKGEVAQADSLMRNTLANYRSVLNPGDNAIIGVLEHHALLKSTQKDYKSAEELLQEGLQICNVFKNEKRAAELLVELGIIYLETNKLKEAEAILKTGLALAEKTANEHIALFCRQNLNAIHSKQEQNPKVLAEKTVQ